MILLGILFFAIGGFSGYQIVNSFYSYPINNELTNEVYYLEAEILKKEEEELAIKKEAEKEKINKPNEERLNEEKPKEEEVISNEIPDPIIDSLLITTLTYVLYSFSTFKILIYGAKSENQNPQPPLVRYYNLLISKICGNDENNANIRFFLGVSIISLFSAFFVKIILSLFSSLVFGVHGFWWNLSESYNLVFYLKRGFLGVLAFLLNIIIFCVLLIILIGDNNQQQNNQNDNDQNILLLNEI